MNLIPHNRHGGRRRLAEYENPERRIQRGVACILMRFVTHSSRGRFPAWSGCAGWKKKEITFAEFIGTFWSVFGGCGSAVLGGIAGSAVLYVIAKGKDGFSLAGGFAANGYAEHSPGGYNLAACLTVELVLTFMFLMIILGATDLRAPKGFAPIAISLGLTLIHLIGIPVTNLSVNPARSTGPAVFLGGWALEQLWLFWVAPLIGAAVAGVVYSVFVTEPEPSVRESMSASA